MINKRKILAGFVAFLLVEGGLSFLTWMISQLAPDMGSSWFGLLVWNCCIVAVFLVIGIFLLVGTLWKWASDELA